VAIETEETHEMSGWPVPGRNSNWTPPGCETGMPTPAVRLELGHNSLRRLLDLRF